MNPVRALAQPLAGAIFLLSGLDVLGNPEPRAKMAAPVVNWVADLIPVAPRDPVAAVSLNATVHLAGGAMLVAGVFPRLAALALAGSLVPTTFGGHRFWEHEDQMQRAQQRTQFLKNAAILGGLLLLALD
jgi:uncharacterized membrane protein YphA (DoxX/SURF4 family)